MADWRGLERPMTEGSRKSSPILGFTPGPWVGVRASGGTFSHSVIGAGHHVSGVVRSDSGDTDAANARLIAAAPDLLAALEKISGWCRKYLTDDVLNDGRNKGGYQVAMSEAAAAIRKATQP